MFSKLLIVVSNKFSCAHAILLEGTALNSILGRRRIPLPACAYYEIRKFPVTKDRSFTGLGILYIDVLLVEKNKIERNKM